MADQGNRPNPLAKVALTVGAVVGVITAVAGGAVALHIISAEQGAALTTVGTQLPTVISDAGVLLQVGTGLVSALAAAFGTFALGKKHVTPVSSPAMEDPAHPGTLIPLVPKVTDLGYSYRRGDPE